MGVFLTGFDGFDRFKGKNGMNELSMPREERLTDFWVKRVKPVKFIKREHEKEIVANERQEARTPMGALRLPKNAARELVEQFVNDRCDVGYELTVSPFDLYDAYVEWVISSGSLLISKHQFGHVLSGLGFTRLMLPGGARVRGGLAPKVIA